MLSTVSRSFEVRRGEEPTPRAYTLVYSPLADRLGIKRGSDQEICAKKVATAISRSWFKVDALLDGDALYSEIDQGKLAQEKEEALGAQLVIDGSVSSDIREKVGEMEMAARKRAYEAHNNFMGNFDPATSTFDEVLGYRSSTTGLMAETILNAIHIVSGNDVDISTLRESTIREALCLQMCDDLVDSVSDYRKRRPNLLYALSLEYSIERSRFEAASMNQAVIDTRRPYDIVQLYAPSTLLSYVRRFQSMSQLLPPDRRQFTKDFMAMMTHLSFSPNATIGKVSRSDIGPMLAKRTKIE